MSPQLIDGVPLSELEHCEHCAAMLLPKTRCACQINSLTTTSKPRLAIRRAIRQRLAKRWIRRAIAIGRGPASEFQR